MSTRLEMLQVARLAPRLLGESSDNVRTFLLSQLAGGGFADRRGVADLYYTVFGLDASAALEADGPTARPDGLETYLDNFGSGAELDLVHLACLARARAASGLAGQHADGVVTHLLELRRDDGGWAMTPADPASTSYGTFLAIGALQDLGLPIARPAEAADLLDSMALPGGGYALDARTPVATTPTTAAAIVALRQLGRRAAPDSVDWLLARHHRQGGFLAADGAPMPDLLSTAVALHALSVLEATPHALKETLLDFVDTLWTAKGGFYGQWSDEAVDVEYTFYGLLALGHLAVME